MYDKIIKYVEPLSTTTQKRLKQSTLMVSLSEKEEDYESSY